MLPVTVKRIQYDGTSRLDVRSSTDPLQQFLERPGGLDAHQQDVTFVAGHRMARLDLLDVLGVAGTNEEPSALSLIIAVPFTVLGLALLVELGFRKGTTGPNPHGPDPLAPQRPSPGG